MCESFQSAAIGAATVITLARVSRLRPSSRRQSGAGARRVIRVPNLLDARFTLPCAFVARGPWRIRWRSVLALRQSASSLAGILHQCARRRRGEHARLRRSWWPGRQAWALLAEWRAAVQAEVEGLLAR